MQSRQYRGLRINLRVGVAKLPPVLMQKWPFHMPGNAVRLLAAESIAAILRFSELADADAMHTEQG